MNKSIPEKISIPKPIVLIGMMGAGKTSVGKIVASLLDALFFDADHEIEAAAGCPVAQIFTDYGESEFRRLERKVVERLLRGGPCVLSLGGGAYMDSKTREAIKRTALTVWIKVDREILLERVSRHDTRPLLRGGDPKKILEKILSEREPVYAQADLVVPCDARPVAQNAKIVRDALLASPAFQTAQAKDFPP